MRSDEPEPAVNLSYASLALILLVPLAVVLIRTRFRYVGWVAAALASFARRVVLPAGGRHPVTCDLPMGTHWLWHTFGAITTLAITEYFYRLEVERVDDRAPVERLVDADEEDLSPPSSAPTGRSDNSPGRQPWVTVQESPSPNGATQCPRCVAPLGLRELWIAVIPRPDGLGYCLPPRWGGRKHQPARNCRSPSSMTSVSSGGGLPNFAANSSRVGTSRTCILLSWCSAMSANL